MWTFVHETKKYGPFVREVRKCGPFLCMKFQNVDLFDLGISRTKMSTFWNSMRKKVHIFVHNIPKCGSFYVCENNLGIWMVTFNFSGREMAYYMMVSDELFQ